jgi:hypothetical protein
MSIDNPLCSKSDMCLTTETNTVHLFSVGPQTIPELPAVTSDGFFNRFRSLPRRQRRVTISSLISDMHSVSSCQIQPLGDVSDAETVSDRGDVVQDINHNADAIAEPENVSPLLKDGKRREAPSEVRAIDALADLKAKLRGESRGVGGGYKDPHLDPFVRHRLEAMHNFLQLYTAPKSKTRGQWGASALQAAVGSGRGVYCARQICKLTRQYIEDHSVLPLNPYGSWNESMLVDENLSADINLHLQELGKDITALKVVEYLARQEVKEKHGITKSISERTARRYLHALGYRYMTPVKGQYADGHERSDVVWYREKRFLPKWAEISKRMHNWSNENLPFYGPHLPGRQVIVWFHDETIFYANDRRRKAWYHVDASAKPYAKGDGASLMVADFVSAEFGWLSSPDGSQTARRTIKPGKNKDGYFTSDDIALQANKAMDILNEFYPEYEHIFIYDNATTHLKRPDGSLSARNMPMKTSARK